MSRRIHRTSGGQPGNHNALKHGFYSKFRTVARVDHVPARAAIKELDHDVALTRATLRDLFAHDPHNAKLITYTMSLHNRLLRARQTLIDRDKRAKRRQSRAHHGSGSSTGPTGNITVCLPTFSLHKGKIEKGFHPMTRETSHLKSPELASTQLPKNGMSCGRENG